MNTIVQIQDSPLVKRQRGTGARNTVDTTCIRNKAYQALRYRLAQSHIAVVTVLRFRHTVLNIHISIEVTTTVIGQIKELRVSSTTTAALVQAAQVRFARLISDSVRIPVHLIVFTTFPGVNRDTPYRTVAATATRSSHLHFSSISLLIAQPRHFHRDHQALLRSKVHAVASHQPLPTVTATVLVHREPSVFRSDKTLVRQHSVEHQTLTHTQLISRYARRNNRLHHRHRHTSLILHSRHNLVLVLNLRLHDVPAHLHSLIAQVHRLHCRGPRVNNNVIPIRIVLLRSHAQLVVTLRQLNGEPTIVTAHTLGHQGTRHRVAQHNLSTAHMRSLVRVVGVFVTHIHHQRTRGVAHRRHVEIDVRAVAILTINADTPRHRHVQLHTFGGRQSQHHGRSVVLCHPRHGLPGKRLHPIGQCKRYLASIATARIGDDKADVASLVLQHGGDELVGLHFEVALLRAPVII